MNIIRKCLENRQIHFGVALVGFIMSIATLVITITHLTSISNLDSDEINIPQMSSLSFKPVCLDCGKLIRDPYTIDSNQSLTELLHVEIRDGHSVCCFNNTRQLDRLVDIFLKDKPTELTPPKAERNVPGEPVAAHKYLYGGIQDVRPERHSYLLFNTSDSVNEHTNGVAVMEHGLVIQYTGMYYVYSSIRFTSAVVDTHPRTYDMHVQHKSTRDRTTTILLKAQYSGRKQFQESTFTGGVFVLHAGDVVQVCVSEPGVVDASESTYAGLIMLGSHIKNATTMSD